MQRVGLNTQFCLFDWSPKDGIKHMQFEHEQQEMST